MEKKINFSDFFPIAGNKKKIIIIMRKTAAGRGKRAGGCASVRQGAAGARHGRAWPGRASWASWVLVHPAWFFDLVFDSVMFLSHCLNPVDEHCSSRNFSKKNIFIKINKNKI